MKAAILARKIHKWVALIVGIQVLFWMLTGVYMVVVNIDFIHGDSLVQNLNEPLPNDAMNLYPIAEILDRYPETVSVDLVTRKAVPYFIVHSPSETVLLDARSGRQMSPISREFAAELANYFYAGDGTLGDVVLLTEPESAPQEIRGRPLPLWQAVFDDSIATTFYLSPSTGELLTRRHTFWRIYDFLWMFHIMDYENRTDINSNLLRLAAFIGLAMALSGIWLLIHSLRGRRSRGMSTAAVSDQRGRSYGPVSKAT